MPLYFFDIQDSKGFHRDEAGEDLDGFDEAREQCQAILSQLVSEELPDGDLHKIVCGVRDQAGAAIYRGEITYQGRRQ